MKKFFYTKFLVMLLLISPLAIAQSSSVSGQNQMDQEFLDSLPDSVREDILNEMKNSNENNEANVQKRPSSELSKLETVREWEKFRLSQQNIKKSERYGIKLFDTMQSSFMPLNEPNFGNNYIIDYGDVIGIEVFGASNNKNYKVEVSRDGSITLQNIGTVMVGGLNFEQATELIKKRYEDSSFGVGVIVVLDQIRDINILITGAVEFPGIYTLSGNSNVLQALNIAGGIKENGSLREIIIKRKGKDDVYIDLYKALIFGDIDNIPSLMSGDSVHIEPAKNLVRAGYGFSEVAIYELKNGETIQDLINFSGGLNLQAGNDFLNLVRFEDKNFVSKKILFDQFEKYELKHLDSIYAFEEQVGVVTISGEVKFPGKYTVSSNDRLLDIIERSGGYNDSAYVFGGVLNRESIKVLEDSFAKKTYKDLITYIASKPGMMSNSSGESLAYILNELKEFQSFGRLIAEFDIQNLKDNIQDNIYLSDGDNIYIPTYSSNVYIFGEVSNPGAVLFKENSKMQDYINKSGGFTRFSSKNYVFIVSPNGETKKVNIGGIQKFLKNDYEVFPGSVIYVPRYVDPVESLELTTTFASIFSSLALSVASINTIND
jgi:protein involved in polysaccharide export with SLBB domain